MCKLPLCFAAVLALSVPLCAQERFALLPPLNLDLRTAVHIAALPDAPMPQGGISSDDVASSSQQTQTPAAPQQPETEQQRREKAAQELKQEESQRIGGIIPNFNAVNNGKAEPLTPGQKFQLFFHGSHDPYQFALAGLDALIGQAQGTPRGYGGGVYGFGRRFGSNYGDNFDGNFWGNAVLPSVLHQDPRYFRMGHGPIYKRALYSISTTFRCHGDNGGWQPNVSNLVGNLIGASISNLYYPDYPDNERGLYPTLRRGISITYQGTAGALLIEFYPDIAQKYKHHHERVLLEKQANAKQAVQH